MLTRESRDTNPLQYKHQLLPACPKSDNATLQGRALNRRVELVRTDR
jgi:hypothetical protein